MNTNAKNAAQIAKELRAHAQALIDIADLLDPPNLPNQTTKTTKKK